jgi:hypothetical protein
MRWPALLCLPICLVVHDVEARTFSVVAFESEYGVVFFDSADSKAAFRLFEALNVEVENRVIAETKIFAPQDGSFRIACTGLGADYSCAVMVYAGRHAALDFDTDRVELTLPAELARHYEGVFPVVGGQFHFETEDHRLRIDWSRDKLHILAHGKA